MIDREKVISHFEDALSKIKSVDWWVNVRKDFISDTLILLKEQERLIEEARCEGYNEAYRSYCVEVAEEDQEDLRYAVDRDEQDLKDAEFD